MEGVSAHFDAYTYIISSAKWKKNVSRRADEERRISALIRPVYGKINKKLFSDIKKSYINT